MLTWDQFNPIKEGDAIHSYGSDSYTTVSRPLIETHVKRELTTLSRMFFSLNETDEFSVDFIHLQIHADARPHFDLFWWSTSTLTFCSRMDGQTIWSQDYGTISSVFTPYIEWWSPHESYGQRHSDPQSQCTRPWVCASIRRECEFLVWEIQERKRRQYSMARRMLASLHERQKERLWWFHLVWKINGSLFAESSYNNSIQCRIDEILSVLWYSFFFVFTPSHMARVDCNIVSFDYSTIRKNERFP
jgi:hypothetical protein